MIQFLVSAEIICVIVTSSAGSRWCCGEVVLEIKNHVRQVTKKRRYFFPSDFPSPEPQLCPPSQIGTQRIHQEVHEYYNSRAVAVREPPMQYYGLWILFRFFWFLVKSPTHPRRIFSMAITNSCAAGREMPRTSKQTVLYT